jgi:putative membrane protein
LEEASKSMDNRNRDYLANERTFLAYLRTGLAFIAFGFVVARFSLFAREFAIVAHVNEVRSLASTEFGTGMAIVGIIISLYGTLRYAHMKAAIDSAHVAPAPVWGVVLTGVVVAFIGVVVAVALLAYH